MYASYKYTYTPVLHSNLFIIKHFFFHIIYFYYANLNLLQKHYYAKHTSVYMQNFVQNTRDPLSNAANEYKMKLYCIRQCLNTHFEFMHVQKCSRHTAQFTTTNTICHHRELCHTIVSSSQPSNSI